MNWVSIMYNSKLSITCLFILVVIQKCYGAGIIDSALSHGDEHGDEHGAGHGAGHGDGISESALRHAIFENYDKLVRPVRSASTAIPVTASLTPVDLRDIDVKDKIIELDTWFTMKWHDDYLTWDPSSYGGLDALRVPSDEVWKPDLTVYTSTPDSMAQPHVHTNVVLYSNGTVLWVPPFTVKSRCPVTEDQVTVDHFKCTITVGSWTYDVTLLDLHVKAEDVLALAEVDHALDDIHHEWTLESMHAKVEQKHYSCCTEAYPVIHYDLVLKKKEDDHHH